MFGTLRKHKTWLWILIMTGTIVSFVIWFSPDARWGGRGRGGDSYGMIMGRPVTSQDYWEANRETRLLYFLNFQDWPERDKRARQMGFNLQNESYMRLLRLAEVREEKIQVPDQTVGQLARRMLGPKGSLDEFVKQVLQPANLSEMDFERFLRHDVAIQQLGAVAGLIGKLAPPREVEANYRDEHEEVDLQAVFFSTSNYQSSVTVTEPSLLQYYSNSIAMFRIPDKMRVSYVEFNRTNFYPEVDKRLSEITNLNAQLEIAYAKQDPESFKDENGKVLSKEAALAKIKETDRNNMALMLARRKASEFGNLLYDQKDHTVAGFEKFAAAQGWPTRVSEPFDQVDGPTDLAVPESFARATFAITNREEAILFQPVEGLNGVYVAAVKERIPGSNPPFESIRSKVVERYRYSEAQKLVMQAARAFQAALTNGLAQGKSFAALATQAGLRPVSLPPISRSSREVPGLPPNVYLQQIKGVAFNLDVGKASPLIPSAEGGYILFLRGRLPIDETKMKADLADYAASMRQQRQNEAYAMWFRKQAESAQLPLERTDEQGGGGSGPAGRRPAGAPGRAR